MDEPQLRCDSHRLRPFVQSARVHHRGCSRPLQRAVTDFAADVPFAQAMDKLVEHYGVLLGESTIRRITEAHARRIHADTVLEQAWPTQAGAATVIVEMAGGMAPLVEPVAHSADHRKYKQLRWQEAKLCLAHAAGSTRLHVGGTLQGDVDDAGQHLFHCARQAGLGVHSRVHAVGDGASWISAQVEARFGAQGEYLVDFYHVCEYLGAAAAAIEPLPAARAAWLDEQKQRLKTRCADAVLATLAPHREAPHLADENAPVRRCHRYLSHRLHQLDYQHAIAGGLPIGSGEIESAHRYIVQARLKRPGAWWRAANAEHMLALRLNRANRQWLAYWARQASHGVSQAACENTSV